MKYIYKVCHFQQHLMVRLQRHKVVPPLLLYLQQYGGCHDENWFPQHSPSCQPMMRFVYKGNFINSILLVCFWYRVYIAPPPTLLGKACGTSRPPRRHSPSSVSCLSLKPPPNGTCMECLLSKATRGHLKRMSEPPLWTPFDVEEKRIYSPEWPSFLLYL